MPVYCATVKVHLDIEKEPSSISDWIKLCGFAHKIETVCGSVKRLDCAMICSRQLCIREQHRIRKLIRLFRFLSSARVPREKWASPGSRASRDLR